MKNTRKQNIFVLTTLAAAMTGAFATMPAYADDEERAALTQPQNSADAEVITVSRGSAQFGQYNGLNRSGAYGNANINFRAGDAYTGNESGGTTRVTIIGTDLGLSDRSASAKYEDQGSWSIGVGYDALTHVIGTASGYQTPYGNGVGQNRFTLPNGFGSICTDSTSANCTNTTWTPGKTGSPGSSPPVNAGVLTGAQYLNNTQLGSFGPQTIQTTRDTYSANGSWNIDPRLTATFDVSHMIQTGAKLMSFAMSPVSAGGTGIPTAGTIYSNGNSAENSALFPNPTNYQTDTANAALEWKGDGYRLAVSYFGSFFRNQYALTGVQFQPAFNAATATGISDALQTMSTMPNNMMNQLTLGGGYDFSDKTKLNGSFSWGRNTSSPGAAYDSATYSGNVPDFNGLVNQIHGDLKLVDRSVKDLVLTAAGKIDQRDNMSSSSRYQFLDIAGKTIAYANAPMSWRKGVIELAGDYKIDNMNTLRLAYQNEQVRRWCNSYAGGTFGTIYNSDGTSSTANANVSQGSACVAANNDSTNSVSLLYKLKASDSVNLKVMPSYSARVVDYNPNAIGSFYTNSGTVNATNPPGINGGDFSGFHPYYEASRQQLMIKGVLNWQASNQLGFSLTGKVTSDTYPGNTYGVQQGNGWSVTLDSSYNWSETGTAYAYATQQQGSRLYTNQNGTTGTFSNTLNDMATTVGLGAKEKGLLGGKLTVTGDALFSLANSNYNAGLNYGTSATCMPTSSTTSTAGTSVYTYCGNLPSIVNNMYQLKTTGIYQVDKHSKIGLAYMYQHLYSQDFLYSGYQLGNNPSQVMPTMQNSGSPSYAVNVVQAKYIYDF